ncbi:MAG: flagellar basal body P-ring formation chaperone FlgA [Vicinamibacterales bacterium]
MRNRPDLARAAALAALLVVMVSARVSADAAEASVDRAIVAAVRQRMGADVEVIVESLRIFIQGGASMTCVSGRCQAVPDPAARLGGTIRFALVVTEGPAAAPRVVRAGTAEARVRAIAPFARAVRLIARGEDLTGALLATTRGELPGAPLRRLPSADDIVGSRALRDIAAGERVSASMIAAEPAVRSGQDVTAVSRTAGLEVSATLVAAESGAPGSIIRVVNRDSRRTLKARVLSPSHVEIIP